MRTTLPLINTANALSADHPALPGNAIQDTSGFSQILSQEISQQNTPPAMAVTASSSPAAPANAAPSANSQQPAVMDQTSANQVNTQNNNQANNQTGANAQNNGTTPAGNTTNNTGGTSSAAASSTATNSTASTTDSKKKPAQSASQTTDQSASQATSALTTEMLAQAAGLTGQPAPSSTPSSVINTTNTTSATRLTDTASRLSNTHADATSHTTAPVSTSAGLSLPADMATFQMTGATSTSTTSAGTVPAKTALPDTVDLPAGGTGLPTPSGTDAKAALLATNIVPPASNNAVPAGASLAISAPSDANLINTLPGTVLSEAATGTDVSNQLSAQVGTPDWNQALSQRVVWMVHGGEQSATLSLNPPDLGPLQVVLNVSNSQANATFITAQPEVKQALEAAMPRLEAMLAGAGIQLGQANVQSGNSGQRQPSQPSPGQSGLSQINNLRSGNGQPNSSLLPLNTEKPYSGQGLVNTFV